MSVVCSMNRGFALAAGLLLIAGSGCSSSEDASNGSGGAAGVGGATTGGKTSGNNPATGGSVSSSSAAIGGAAASGGAAATGGVLATGGSKAATTAKATGGAKASGGAGSGGVAATGGKAAGGASTAPHTTGVAGSDPTGGATGAGGAGTQAAGGTGTKAIGGSGTKAVGGTGPSASGGATSGGGAAPTGGQNSGTGGSTQSVSCPSNVLKSGDSNVTLQVDGQDRKFILHVPSAYKGDKAVPLIVDFHPIMGTASGEEGSSPFKAVTDPEGVITAYPDGKPSPLNNGQAWNVGPCCVANVDDVGFAKAIVADVSKKACIDPKRVYAVGFSMGGGMSHYIGCKAADVFAAVAPAAFDLLKGSSTSSPKGNADECKPVRPIPVLSFRGTGDGTALYNGGDSAVVPGMPIYFLGAKACWQKWAEIDGCTDSPAYPNASGSWQCSYYKQCKENVQVGVCVNTGGHSYGDGKIGWDFLKQFTLP